MNRRTLMKILCSGAGAVIGSKILHLPGFDNLAAASDIVRRQDFPVTDPCHLTFTIEKPLQGDNPHTDGNCQKGNTIIRDLDLDSVCVRSVDQKDEITYSSFEKRLMAKAEVAQESRYFYQLYNANNQRRLCVRL